MAEGYEENVATLVRASGRAYMELRGAYMALPLPIALPIGFNANGVIEEFHDALLDAADRLTDLPVDEVAMGLLYAATLHWVTASTVIRSYVATRFESHLIGAAWGMEQALDAAELAGAMLRAG